MREHLGGEPFLRQAADVAVALQLFEDEGVVVGVAHDRHAIVILGRGAQHAGAANVDVLDQLFEGHAGLGQRLLEGVQIHDHQVDGLGTDAFEIGVVGTRPSEQRAVHAGVQRLDSTIHHFR